MNKALAAPRDPNESFVRRNLIYESPFGVTTMVELNFNVFRSGAGLLCALLLVSRVSIVTATDAPELPKPNSELQPGEIVEIVINALAKNDQPFPNAGIQTTFNFASPANRAFTGPLDRFTTLVKGPVYGQMVNHLDSTLSQVIVEDGKALCLVQIVDSENETSYYAFRLELQQEGDYAGMWLTEAVWPLQNPDRDVLAL